MSKKLPFKEACKDCKDAILRGTVLAIDPSSGNANRPSSLGIAVYHRGELVNKGRLAFESSPFLPERLCSLKGALEEFSWTPDVLAIEHVMLGKFHNGALIAAWGVIVAAVDAPITIPVPPISWRKHKPEDYKKDDVTDAILIGKAVIEAAKA